MQLERDVLFFLFLRTKNYSSMYKNKLIKSTLKGITEGSLTCTLQTKRAGRTSTFYLLGRKHESTPSAKHAFPFDFYSYTYGSIVYIARTAR